MQSKEEKAETEIDTVTLEAKIIKYSKNIEL